LFIFTLTVNVVISSMSLSTSFITNLLCFFNGMSVICKTYVTFNFPGDIAGLISPLRENIIAPKTIVSGCDFTKNGIVGFLLLLKLRQSLF